MPSYLQRLVARAIGPAPRRADVLHDPFDAAPLPAEPLTPSLPVAVAPAVPPPAAIPTPAPRAEIHRIQSESIIEVQSHTTAREISHERELVETRLLATPSRERERERERIVITPPDPPALPPLAAKAGREAEAPPIPRSRTEFAGERNVPAIAPAHPEPASSHRATVAEVARRISPPLAPAPVIMPLVPAVDDAQRATAPTAPRLSIGQVIVEVTSRPSTPQVARVEPPAPVVVVRTAPTPRPALFRRGFGVGQS